jgi:F0F1-type ATP synthase assembly protein I
MCHKIWFYWDIENKSMLRNTNIIGFYENIHIRLWLPKYKEKTMAFGKETVQANPNEIVFTKTKGFGSINYAVATSKVNVGETNLSIEKTNRVLFFKRKPKTEAVDYGAIANVEVKTNFAKGDFISGIVIGIIGIIMGIAVEEASGQIPFALFVTAFMIFCAYGKNIVITRKDSSKVVIMSEGLGQGDEIEALKKKLAEHGVNIPGVR